MTNQNLSQQIVQMQSKQLALEKNISSLKQFKYLVHYAVAVQCKLCNKLYPKNHYSSHLPSCNKENERMSTLYAQHNIQPLEIAIAGVDDLVVEIVVKKSLAQWSVRRSLAEFEALFEELLVQFPNYALPYVKDDLVQGASEQTLKNKLLVFLRDLVRIPFVRGSQSFKLFLEIDNNCLEDDSEFEFRRTAFMSGNMSTTIVSGRQSVLNPFVNSSQQLTMVNNSRHYDGRRSVTPSPITHLVASDPPETRVRQDLYMTAKESIQELVEDEDYPSVTTSNRVSLMPACDTLSNNSPSVFSVRNQDIRIETLQTGIQAVSPFQRVEVILIEKDCLGCVTEQGKVLPKQQSGKY